MGIAHYTCYDALMCAADDITLVKTIPARRVQVTLHQQGWLVNHNKVRRLMFEHGLQPRVRRRHVTPTNSNHGSPIFLNRARGIVTEGTDQLWVTDLSDVPVISGVVHVAIILDAWLRGVVGNGSAT